MSIENSHTITPAQRFWRLLKPEKKEIINVYIYAIFNGLVNLSLPIGIQSIINFIQGGQITTSWVILVVFVVMGVAITGVLQIFQLRITENLQQRIFTRAAMEFAFRIPRVKQEAIYRYYAPELMNRFFDTISVQKGLSKILIDFSIATLQVILGLILLSLYHPFFILFGFILLLLLYVIFRFTFGKGLSTSLDESKHKYQVAHWLEEIARTAMTFKLAGNAPLPMERTDKHVGNYLHSRESHFGILMRQYSMMVVFKVVVATGLLAIGGILVMEQQMNIGQFVAAEIIILLIMSSVEKLILNLETIYDVLTSLEKIGQVTDLELEQTEGRQLPMNSGGENIEVELDKISFGYPGNGKKILEGLSLHIRPGEKLMICGPNMAGKSTLLRIIAALYTVQEGHVSFNGYSSGNLDMSSLRSAVGDCFTEEELFQGTVTENISLGRKSVSMDDIKKLTERLNLTSFIRSLPRGFDTVLDPQGKKLSRSVVQKLLLARSIAGNPGLLLLEDAFEHFSNRERNDIIDFFVDRSHKWTLVAVSSDPYLAKQVDRIAIIEEGKITQIGTYEEMKTFINTK